ncbi:fluoride efflux transporter CrcB [Anoxybacterium hadale]|uniref:Fluoride efflux transporter CrcB n=1 Tax=Anoxybacterium hadale TaxID=3408580 RepID=A0ACD1AFM0_9FIRM|nr:fluoride efflux transporter CrcB [Clostridiales bacterium]
MSNYLMVLVGGSCGAVCRFALSSIIKRLLSTEFPIATLLINAIGSFFIGLLMSAHPGDFHQLLLGTGFMGGFTTFSTFQYENISLLQKKSYLILSSYIISSFVLCILLALLGLHLGGSAIFWYN